MFSALKCTSTSPSFYFPYWPVTTHEKIWVLWKKLLRKCMMTVSSRCTDKYQPDKYCFLTMFSFVLSIPVSISCVRNIWYILSVVNDFHLDITYINILLSNYVVLTSNINTWKKVNYDKFFKLSNTYSEKYGWNQAK